jgi:hypothetical protein
MIQTDYEYYPKMCRCILAMHAPACITMRPHTLDLCLSVPGAFSKLSILITCFYSRASTSPHEFCQFCQSLE